MSTEAIKMLIAQSDGYVLNEFMLGEGVYSIGAGSECQIQVGSIASEHARLEVNGALMLL